MTQQFHMFTNKMRNHSLELTNLRLPQDAELEYAPTTGIRELREKVAKYYNHLYRQGKESQYSFENVTTLPTSKLWDCS